MRRRIVVGEIAVVPMGIWGNAGLGPVADSAHCGAAALMGVVIFGALAEELMFRGYPFQRLVEGIGPTGVIFVFSVLFGVVHLSNPGETVWGLINTVAIGVLLSVAYLRTHALWLPWGIHFAWNGTLGLILDCPSAACACLMSQFTLRR